MSAQEEFVHPVIAAMQNAYQLMQNAKKQKFDQQLETRQADLAQQQFDEAKKQHEIDKDFREKNLEIALQELQQSLRKQHLTEAQMLQEYSAKGGKAERKDLTITPTAQTITGPNGEVSQLPAPPPMTFQGQGNSVLPGTDIQFDPANYQSQDEAIQQQLNTLRQSRLITNQVDQPFKDAENQRIMDRQEQQDQRRFVRDLTVHNADRASAERVAQMKDQTDRYLGELNARTRLSLAQAGLDSNNPAIDNYVNDMYVAGNMDKIPGSTKVQNAIRGAVPPNWTPLNKEDKGSIEQINVIDNLLEKTKKLADIGSTIGGKTGVFFGFGEAANVNKEVEGMLGTLSRGIGKEKGVLTQKDIERAKGLVYDIRQGKDGNGQKYQDLKNLLDSGYRQLLQKYPDDQRSAILTSRGVDPQRFAAPTTGKKKTMIELDNGDRIPDTPQNRQLHGLPLE